MSGNDEEVLSIPLDVTGIDDAEEAANTLEKLRDAMRGATDSLRANQAALRSLKGSSDEVKTAREKLKAAIQGEQNAISAGTLKLLKQGTTYEKLAQQAKKAEEAKKQGMQAVKGPLGDFSAGLERLKGLFGQGNAGAVAMSIGVAALAAGIVVLVGSLAHGAVSLAHWAVESANAMRNMALLREAVGGTAANGEALGTWVDQLARKLPLSTEKLNELATNITRTFNGTMVGGQGIVDTFQAVAGASAAMGDQAGAAIQSIIDRGKQFGRGGVGLFELQGTGLQFDKLAAQVAKSMHTTMQNARMQLASGMVPIETLAASLKDTVNERFGEINAKKFLSLDSIAQRFQDRLSKLTTGFDMKPILEGLEKLSSMFDTSTVTGDALKQLMTTFGRLLGSTFKSGVPIVQSFFETLVIWTQKAVIWSLKAALFFKEHMEAIKVGAAVLGGVMLGAVVALTAAMIPLATSVLAATWPFLAIGAAIGLVAYGIYELVNHWDDVKQFFANLATGIAQWVIELTASAVGWGQSVIDGFVQGIQNAWNGAVDTVKGLANGVKDTFTNALRIHSPSAVFAEYGQQTTAGYVEGVEGSSGDASKATARMAPSPGGGAAGRGGGSVSFGDINVTVNAAPGASGQEMGQQAAESFKSQVLAFFEELGAAEGNPTQTVEAT